MQRGCRFMTKKKRNGRKTGHRKRSRRFLKKRRLKLVFCISGIALFLVMVDENNRRAENGAQLLEVKNENETVFLGSERDIPLSEMDAWRYMENAELHMDWYDDVKELAIEEKTECYMRKVADLLASQTLIHDERIEYLESADREKWETLHRKIQGLEQLKVPEEYMDYWPERYHDIPAEALKPLSSTEYQLIGNMCGEACNILAQSSMKSLQARNFGDAMVMALKEQNWELALRCGKSCIENYEGLFCFIDREMTDSEVCCWSADAYFQLFYHGQFKTGNLTADEIKEHCWLMADAWARNGIRFAEEAGSEPSKRLYKLQEDIEIKKSQIFQPACG